MKKLIGLISLVLAFTLYTNAQDLYVKGGPSLAVIEQSHVDEEAVVFYGFKGEIGFETYHVQHAGYFGTYLNNQEKGMNLTKQMLFDIGYTFNFYPNIYGHRLGYFGAGLMFRVSEHDAWNPNYPDNDYYSWNFPIRAGITFMPSSEVRPYMEAEYSIHVAGNKFHGLTFTFGLKF